MMSRAHVLHKIRNSWQSLHGLSHRLIYKAVSCMCISTSTNQQLRGEDGPPATTSSTFVKKQYTVFDHIPANVINLQMGAPGEALLKKSKEIMKKAAVHKMVGAYHILVKDPHDIVLTCINACTCSDYISFIYMRRRQTMPTGCFSTVLRLEIENSLRHWPAF